MCDLMLKQKTCPLRPNGCNLGMNERWALENWWLENNDTRHVQERSPCLMKKMHVCLFSKASSGKRLLNRDVCLTHISSPSIKMHELCICSKRTAGWGSVCMYDLYEAYTCNWKSMLNQYHIIYHFFAVTASSNTFYKKYWKRLSSCYSKVYFQHDLSCWKYTYYELIKDQPSWIHKVQIKKNTIWKSDHYIKLKLQSLTQLKRSRKHICWLMHLPSAQKHTWLFMLMEYHHCEISGLKIEWKWVMNTWWTWWLKSPRLSNGIQIHKGMR